MLIQFKYLDSHAFIFSFTLPYFVLEYHEKLLYPVIEKLLYLEFPKTLTGLTSAGLLEFSLYFG